MPNKQKRTVALTNKQMNLLIHPSTYHDQWAFNQQGYVTVDFDPGKLYRVTPIQQQKLYEYLLFQKKREEP